MVVPEILGVVKLVPVASDEPPDDAAYQLIVPALAVAPNPTVPVPQREPSVVPVMVVVLIVAVTAVLVAVVQPLSVAST